MDILDELKEQFRQGPETYIGQLCKEAANHIQALRTGKSKLHREFEAERIRSANYSRAAREWRDKFESATSRGDD